MGAVKDIKVQTAVHFSIADLERLEQATKKIGKPRSELIREAVNFYLDHLDKKK